MVDHFAVGCWEGQAEGPAKPECVWPCSGHPLTCWSSRGDFLSHTLKGGAST